jgi:hypothetical protein
LSLFAPDVPAGLLEVQQMLEELDVNTLTPIEALLKLSEMKRKI